MGRLREWGRRQKHKMLEQLEGSKNISSTSLPTPSVASSPQNPVPEVLITATEPPTTKEPTRPLGSVSAAELAPRCNQPRTDVASTISLPNYPVADLSATIAPIYPAVIGDTKRGERVKKVTWAGLKTFLGLLDASSNAFPPLKSAVEGLNRCIEVFEDAAKGQKDYEELRGKLDQLLENIIPFSNNLTRTGPAITTSVRALCSGIEAELKIVTKKQSRNTLERQVEATNDPDDILGCYRRIHGHVERLMLNANLNIWKTMDEELANTRLYRLSLNTDDGAYNSRVSDKVQRGLCVQGTREFELQKLKDWARNSSAETVCWLNGMAGTGKTTISYSLCSELDATGELAASFYCSRSIPECRDVHLIIPAIAYQLAQFSHPFRFALSKAIELDPKAHTRELRIQFQRLIVRPLEEVQHALPSDFIVVIDALDECDDSGSVGKIVDILTLSSSTSKLPVRFLISSRPEPEIYHRMVKQVGNIAKLVLHELDSLVVKSDIENYLRHELHDVPLTSSQWASLIKRCDVLFIYASTAARYIREGYNMDNYEEALDTVLGMTPLDPEESMAALDALYTTILQAAFGNSSRVRRADKERMKAILHTIVCAREPMTVEALAGLLHLKNGNQAGVLLRPLRSIINVAEDTSVVAVLHASFADFILSKSRSGDLCYCEAILCHNNLSLACLRQIRSNETQFNICGFESSYLLDDAVTEPGTTVRANRAVSPSLSYACRYWVAHLDLGGQLVNIQEPLYDFLSARLLLWMEVLNTKNCVRIGVKMMKDVENWCRNKRVGASEDIIDLAHDAWQFVSVYANHPVSQSTPHIYTSMLPFWPNPRPLTKHYTARTVGIPLPQGTAMAGRQSALLATWSVGKQMISICYSPDGTQVIVAAEKNVYVLNGWTGQITLGPLEGHTRDIDSVATSPDGSMIASGSDNGTIRLWDAKTGELVGHPLRRHSSAVTSVVFSPDSTRFVAVTSCWGPQIWSIQTGKCVSCTTNHSIDNAVFSADGLYVTATTGVVTLFWDANTGALMDESFQRYSYNVGLVTCSPNDLRIVSNEHSGHPSDTKNKHKSGMPDSEWRAVNAVNKCIFSPNGLYVASSSYRDCAIRIWYAETLKMATNPLEGHTSEYCSFVFSPDSTRLASCSFDGTVRIWNMQNLDQNTDIPEDLFQNTWSVKFSCDGSQVVTGSFSGTLCLWDLHTGRLILGPLMGHKGTIYSVDISSDGSYIASASQDETIRLWDVRDGKGTCKILDTDITANKQGSVGFSSDSLHLVFTPEDGGDKVYSVGDSLTITDSASNLIGECSTKDLKNAKHFPFKTDLRSLPDGAQRIILVNKACREYLDNTYMLTEPFAWYPNHLYSVSFSPDLSCAVSCFDNGTILLWDVQSGQPMMAPFQGHTDIVRLLQFSPDGSRIVTCSEDITIRSWTIPSKDELEKYNPGGDLPPLAASIIFTYHIELGIEQTADTINNDDDSDNNSNEFVESDRDDDADARSKYYYGTGSECYDDIRAHALSLPPSQAWALNEDGWIVSTEGHHLIWVPTDLRMSVLYPRNDALICKRGSFKLDFDGTNIGESWTECYTPAKAEILD